MVLDLQIYIVFHDNFDINNYFILPHNKKYITFYGVNPKQSSFMNNNYNNNNNNNNNIIYEFDLPIYCPFYQFNKYNESSALYHLFINKLYVKKRWIGLFQYDMVFQKGFFLDIEKNTPNPKTIFYLNYFINPRLYFKEGLRGILYSYPGFEAALPYFNTYFKTNFTIYDLNTMPLCNAFIIHRNLFETMMNWLMPYFVQIYNKEELVSHKIDGTPAFINPGHLLEVYTGLFLGLHIKMGYKAVKLNCKHDHNIKKRLGQRLFP